MDLGWLGEDKIPGLVEKLELSIVDVRGLTQLVVVAASDADSFRFRTGSGELFSSWSWRSYILTSLSREMSIKSSRTSPRNTYSSDSELHNVTSSESLLICKSNYVKICLKSKFICRPVSIVNAI